MKTENVVFVVLLTYIMSPYPNQSDLSCLYAFKPLGRGLPWPCWGAEWSDEWGNSIRATFCWCLTWASSSSSANGALMLKMSWWSIGLTGNLDSSSSMIRPSRLSPNNDKRSVMAFFSLSDVETTRPWRKSRDTNYREAHGEEEQI